MLTRSERALLKKARDRIAKGWTQGVYARDAAGQGVARSNLEACRFCLVGSLTADHEELSVQQSVFDLIRSKIGTTHLPSWNDTPGRTQDEVLAVIDSLLREESC